DLDCTDSIQSEDGFPFPIAGHPARDSPTRPAAPPSRGTSATSPRTHVSARRASCDTGVPAACSIEAPLDGPAGGGRTTVHRALGGTDVQTGDGMGRGGDPSPGGGVRAVDGDDVAGAAAAGGRGRAFVRDRGGCG